MFLLPKSKLSALVEVEAAGVGRLNPVGFAESVVGLLKLYPEERAV